jgi:aspartyl-tRNA synthetase
MQQRILTEETLEKIGKKVILAGWVNTVRDHGGIIFVDLRDKSGLVQVIFGGKLAKEAKKLRPEWVIKIEGLVKKGQKN